MATQIQETSQRADYDSPWKNILNRFLAAFMEFCLPHAAADIDWSRGYEFLDKELQAIQRHQRIGNRRTDFLFKVWLKNGTEVWLLLHIEVQAYKDEHLEERMYIYNYRIFDRYNKPILSIAILADDNPNWRPSLYERSSRYNRLQFEFATIKLLDYAKQPALTEHANPFAIVIWAHIESLRTRKKPLQRLQSKLAITRALYKHGFKKEYIIDLLCFIDWVLELPPPLELEYSQDLQLLEETQRVDYITSFERIGHQKGLQKGLEEGLEKGLEQGLLEGERLLLSQQLQHRFGTLSPQYKEQLDLADQHQLLYWGKHLLDAKTLEDVFHSVS